MGNRSIDRALRKASIKNVSTAVAMLGNTEWVSVPTADLQDVMLELSRLQRVESALLHSVESKIEQAGVARLAGDQAAREWQIEEKIHRREEERKLRQEAYQLSLISEGKEVG